jgi:hypothetical protein
MTEIFTPSPTKYPSKLHKKMAKLERQFDKAANQPLKKARLLKAAVSVHNKILKGGEVKPNGL